MGRPAKVKTDEVITTEEVVKENISETELLKEQNKQMADMLKQMSEQMAKMKEQLEAKPQLVALAPQDKGLSGKKIKVINLLNNILNLTTDVDGKGKIVTFEKYGDIRQIKYDDLVEMVASHPIIFEQGWCYIVNKDAVEDLGLSDDYASLYTKELMDELVYLRRESDVEILLGMSRDLLESTVTRIAKLYSLNEAFDFNHIKRIKDETGLDIEAIASDLKEFENVKMV